MNSSYCAKFLKRVGMKEGCIVDEEARFDDDTTIASCYRNECRIAHVT